VRVVDVDEQAVDAVLDQLGNSTDPACDYW